MIKIYVSILFLMIIIGLVMSESQRTRRFIQHLNPLPAAKMRQSASLAVRRRSVCLEPISRGHVAPPDFESEYQEQSRRIELDLCRGMLLFPEEELLLREDPRDLRTEYSTVPGRQWNPFLSGLLY